MSATGTKKNLLVPAVLILLGLAAIIVSVRDLITGKEYLETAALITKIESEYDASEDNSSYTTFVRYTVDGTEYNEQLGYYEHGYEEGKEIHILYNPANPAQIRQAGNGIYIYFLIIGPLVILLGVYWLVKKK